MLIVGIAVALLVVGPPAEADVSKRGPEIRIGALRTSDQGQAQRTGKLRVVLRSRRTRRVRVVANARSGGRVTAIVKPRRVLLRAKRWRVVALRLNPKGRELLFASCSAARLSVVVKTRVRRARRAVSRRFRGRRTLAADLASCAPAVRAGDWPQWQFDLSGSRHNPHERALTPATVDKLKLKWAFVFPGTDGAASSQPALVGDTLYVGARNGIFYALDRRTGATKWTFDTRQVTGPTEKLNLLRDGPAVANGLVYFGDFRGGVYALDAQTGKLRWHTQVDFFRYAILTGSPLVHGDRLYIGVSSNEVFTASSPTYPCCQFRGSMVSLDAMTGKIVWRHYTTAEPQRTGTNAYGAETYAPSGVSIWSTPALDPASDTLYFGTAQNYTGDSPKADSMVALDSRTGRERWHWQATQKDKWNAACLFPVPGGNCPEPGPDFDFGSSPNLFRVGDRLVMGEGQKSGVYHALDARTGEVVWQTILNKASGEGGAGGQEGIQWGSSYDGERLYVSTNQGNPGTLFALDPATGRGIWKTPSPADGCSTGGAASARAGDCTPALPAAVSTTPGLVFEGSRDGKMRVYSSASGKTLWEYDTVRQFDGVNGVSGRGGSISHGGSTIAGGMLYTNSGYLTSGSPFTGIEGNVLLAFGL